jgi:subtilase family serine protease
VVGKKSTSKRKKGVTATAGAKAGVKVKARRAKSKAVTSTVTSARRPSAAAIPPPRMVSVEVLLQPAEGGVSVISTEERIRCSNVDNFRPPRATRDKAARVLTDLGFRVVAYSPFSLSVEGTPALFTKTFGTKLDVFSIDRVQCGRPMREKAYHAPADGATWELPPELRGLVERAYVQRPAVYLESALPPNVDYFHLKVPGDVAMLTRASEVHSHGITGAGVKVAMIDSGFFNHQFYQSHGNKAAVVLAAGALNPAKDNNGHGTAFAANLFATAPGASFTMVKQGNSHAVAFKKAIDLGPDIIICSWTAGDLVDGSPNRTHLSSIPEDLKPLEVEVARAVSKGICVVCAAGNGQVSFPGMHPDVISVGGVFVTPAMKVGASDLASAFDSRPYPGRHVPDLCGLVGMKPQGVYIMLPVQPGCEMDQEFAAGGSFPGGDTTAAGDGWIVASGTSSAAPQIAGVCALLKQKNPSLTPQDLKQALITGAADCSLGSSNPESNQGVALKADLGADGATGHGMVNAAASVGLV